MVKYKINIADVLERRGFNTYKAKTTKVLSQDTLKKIREENQRRKHQYFTWKYKQNLYDIRYATKRLDRICGKWGRKKEV